MGFSIRQKTEEAMAPPKSEPQRSTDFEEHSLVQNSQLQLEQQIEEIERLKKVVAEQETEIQRLNQDLEKAGQSEEVLKERIAEQEKTTEVLRAESEELREKKWQLIRKHQWRLDSQIKIDERALSDEYERRIEPPGFFREFCS